jgi:maltooligosyltrehalose trehalohydrolase
MKPPPLKPGAHVTPEGVRYCVWAPEKKMVEAIISDEERILPLEETVQGYFCALDSRGKAGDLYKFRLDGEDGQTFPDPASRFQPEGVHGPSMVVDGSRFPWKHDKGRPHRTLADLVIYELHVGTFTDKGTYLSAIERLDRLAELGVNTIEIMPLADFPGRWNWGYDGVMPYAPARAYGTPDDLRALIDAAHARGLGVMLDAVYNHLGPDGNYLGAYSKHYFNAAHKTPWGDALNFDGPHHAPVREFFLGNIVYWMEEFHFDGFRLDAVHAIMDETERHLLADIAAAVHERGGFVVAEDERNEARLATPEKEGGVGLDGLWADDFHHTVRVALTGEHEAYLKNFTGKTEELRDTLEHGWHYRGQIPPHGEHKKPRGTECSHLPPSAFVYCISNHDQVGNRAFGERLSVACSPAAYRAASALLCLSPYTPLIFQGQEWAASTPFLYFTDHHAELGRLVTEGRRREFKGFAAFGDEASISLIPDPQAESTFLNSKLDWEEAEELIGEHAKIFALYREALRLRRDEPALRQRARGQWSVASLGDGLLGIAYGNAPDAEQCLVIFRLQAAPALPADTFRGTVLHGPPMRMIFSSDDGAFGGGNALVYNPATGRLTLDEPGLVVLKTASK